MTHQSVHIKKPFWMPQYHVFTINWWCGIWTKRYDWVNDNNKLKYTMKGIRTWEDTKRSH